MPPSHNITVIAASKKLPVISVSGSQGIIEPDRRVASAGMVEITVYNQNGKYSPDNDASPDALHIGDPVVVSATEKITSTAVVLFTGKIISVQPESNRYGQRVLTFTAADLIYDIQMAKLSSLYIPGSLPADRIITRVVDEALLAEYARATLHFQNTVSDQHKVTIGSQVYTFKDGILSPFDSPYDVLVEGFQDNRRNLAAAVMADGEGYGTQYKGPLVPNTFAVVEESLGGDFSTYYSTPETIYMQVGHAGDTTRRSLGQSFVPEYDAEIKQITFVFETPTDPPTGALTFDIVGSRPDGNPRMEDIPTAHSAGGTPPPGVFDYVLPVPYRINAGERYWIILRPVQVTAPFGNWLVQGKGPGGLDSGYAANFYDDGTPSYVWNSHDVRVIVSTRSLLKLRAKSRGAWGNNITLTTTSGSITVYPFSGGTDKPSGNSMDSGRTTFDYMADEWNRPDVNAMDIIEEVVNNEMGYFWVDHNNKLVFKNRNWIVGTGYEYEDNEMHADGGLVMGPVMDELANEININYQPRNSLSSGVIASSSAPIEVPGLSTIEFKLPYQNPNTDGLIGAANIEPIIPGTHYAVNDQPNGSGFDYTDSGRIHIRAYSALGNLVLTITNTATGPLYLLGLQVHGVGIQKLSKRTATARNTGSVNKYGLRSKTIDMSLIDKDSVAKSYADWLVLRTSEPGQNFKSVSYDYLTDVHSDTGGEYIASSLIIRPGARLRLHDYQVLGTEALNVRVLGRAFEFTEITESLTLYGVKPSSDVYWSLGLSQLGIDTGLAL